MSRELWAGASAAVCLLWMSSVCHAGQQASVRLQHSADIAPAAASGAGASAVAAADFDEDGVPDLVTGGAAGAGGTLTVFRGHIDTLYPNSPEAKARKARGEFTSNPFPAVGATMALPQPAEFVATGDFDADGHWDVVVASSGSTKLHWLRGDGRGNLGVPSAIELGGTVTALAAGEVNRVDGLSDLLVGIVTASGARALVFESAEGALRGAPESFALSAAATAFAIGELNGTFGNDFAIAAGAQVLIVHGRDRKLSLGAEQQATVPPAEVTQRTFDADVRSIAVGDFSGDTAHEIAVLAADATVRLLAPGIGETEVVATSAAGSALRLVPAKVSAGSKQDLLIVGGEESARVLVASADGEQVSELPTAPRLAVEAALPMRLNGDALDDLVVIRDGALSAAVTANAAVTFVVTSTALTSDAARGNGVCADANGTCTLLAAMEEINANTNPGPYAIHFNIPGAGVPVISGFLQGEIHKPVTIDGTTQAAGRVEIGATGGVPIQLYGGNSVVRGLAVYATSYAIILGSDGNVVEGNYIGLRADGSKPVGLGDHSGGIIFRGGVNSSRPGNNNLVGGTTAQARNVISGTRQALNLGDTTGNTIRGNYIGTIPAGTAALSNGFILSGAASNLTLGGTTAGAGNVISGANGTGSFATGVELNGSAIVQGNLFGTTADGMQPIPNNVFAIQVSTNEPITIGGTTPSARNVIAASGRSGIAVAHDRGENALIQGNYIGTNAQGTGAFPNGEHGIALSGVRPLTVGGTTAGARNLLSGNTGSGIALLGGVNGTPARSVVIQGNFIGTDVSGTAALPNQDHGVHLAIATGTLLGGSTADARNIISGNADHGVVIQGGEIDHPTRIEGNFVGLNVSGSGALGNGKHGFYIIGNVVGHNIGGPAPEQGNRIAFNGAAGIATESGRALACAVLSNSIFANRGLGIDRNDDGVSAIANSQFNRPVITSINSSGSGTVINGTLKAFNFGGGSQPYTIQFFANTAPDPSGYGEGQEFVGQVIAQGDGNAGVPFTATIAPPIPAGRYVTAVAIGRIQASNASSAVHSSEFAFNVHVAGNPANNPLRISALTPSVGGNNGVVTVKVIGEGIRPGATVSLRGAGQADIVGTVVSISSDGSTIEASFNLTGQSVGGGYEIVVANSDGSSSAISNAFTVQQGGTFDTYASVIGPEIMRVGRNQRFQLAFGNTGNIDAPATKLTVSVPKALFEVFSRPEYPAGAPAFLSAMEETYLMELYVPRVPALSGETLEFILKPLAPADSATIIATAFATPRFSSVVNQVVDPNGTVTLQVVEKTANTEKLIMRIANSGGTEEVPVEITRTAAAGPREPLIVITPNGDRLSIRYEVTKPVSPAARATAASLTPDHQPQDDPLYSTEATTVGDFYGHVNPDGSIDFGAVQDFAPQNQNAAAAVNNRREGNQLLRDRGLIDADRQRQLNRDATAPLPLNLLDNVRNNPDAPAPSERPSVDINRRHPDSIYDDYERRREQYERELRLKKRREQRKDEGFLDSIDATKPVRDQWEPKDEDFDVKPKPVRPVNSWDPNDKAGPPGPGAQRFISGTEPLNYTILFENKPVATAPAQDVVITDQLDAAKFDLATFELGPVRFGHGFGATPPPGLSEWTTDIDLRPSQNLIVRVHAALDKTTGLLTWRFTSLDPATLQPTENAAAGFLPPNKNAPEGDGAVTFRINAKAGLPDGTELRNKARIVFDANAPIDTPEWLNTIDRTPPTSQVSALSATQTGSAFQVTWTGSDAGGSIASYAIYVSANGGPYELWLETTDTSATFYGNAGTSYAFFSVAEDGAANSEAIPAQPDATTSTPNPIPTPTPTPTASPSPTAAPSPRQLLNIATRLRVQTGENVLIGGVIVTGTEPKKVIIRAVGPSLAAVFDGALGETTLELYQGDTLLAVNDDWKDSQQAEIEATTIPPNDERESAIVRTLDPGSYTAVMSGKNGATGIGVVEVYDLAQGAASKLANIATRGFVEAGDDVMIGGLIVGGNGDANAQVLVRAIGPSLGAAGVAGALQDPTLELFDADGNIIRANDDWQQSQAAEIERTTIPPPHPAEAAIIAALPPGNYTAVVRGKNDSTGVGLVEVYSID
jgi:hypothetical protein